MWTLTCFVIAMLVIYALAVTEASRISVTRGDRRRCAVKGRRYRAERCRDGSVRSARQAHQATDRHVGAGDQGSGGDEFPRVALSQYWARWMRASVSSGHTARSTSGMITSANSMMTKTTTATPAPRLMPSR